jgi:hypothetical protein
VLKGGFGLELRLGLVARTTKDHQGSTGRSAGAAVMAARRSPSVPNSEPMRDDTRHKVTTLTDVPLPRLLSARRQAWDGGLRV